MQILNFPIQIQKPFGNLYRKATVNLIVKDPDGNFLLGAKKWYPDGIVRLLGGGINDGEDVLVAARRELKEETGLDISENKFQLVAQVNVKATSEDGNDYLTTIYLAKVLQAISDYTAADDVDGVVALSEKAMNRLIDGYMNLSKEIVSLEDKDPFAWYDYGQVYAKLHQLALDLGK